MASMSLHSKYQKMDKMTDKREDRVQQGSGGAPRQQLPFTKVNFIMMGVCLAMIVLGFVLMSGGGSQSDIAFNPEIFSTRRIVVGPTITFLGFLCMAFAIIWTPRSKRLSNTSDTSNNS